MLTKFVPLFTKMSVLYHIANKILHDDDLAFLHIKLVMLEQNVIEIIVKQNSIFLYKVWLYQVEYRQPNKIIA